MRCRIWSKRAVAGICLVGVIGITGCSDTKLVGEYPDRDPKAGDYTPDDHRKRRENSLFGQSGLSFGGKDKAEQPGEGGSGGIGVNGFLWRASLDTVSFMPVASADPFGGVIITDWHTMPETPDERFKVNVYILGRSLRADGVRVSVFRQVRGGGGSWVDAPVAEVTGLKIEDAILTRARQLRFAALQQQS
jgi:hypothetical protein